MIMTLEYDSPYHYYHIALSSYTYHITIHPTIVSSYRYITIRLHHTMISSYINFKSSYDYVTLSLHYLTNARSTIQLDSDTITSQYNYITL